MTRREGWLVTYRVEVVFDTNNDRTRYDHVGTTASCACCGERLALHGSCDPLVTHSRAHEQRLSFDTAAGTSPGRDHGEVDVHEELAGSA